jgi:hypothetical protein
MQSVREHLINVPTILCLIDKNKARTAWKLFESYFPNFILIRDAVAHSHYEMTPTAAAFRSHVPDNVDIPGLAKGAGLFITNSLHGNNYIITKDKKIASYQISATSHSRLESVRTQFLGAFDNALAEVVKGWPKPPTFNEARPPSS